MWLSKFLGDCPGVIGSHEKIQEDQPTVGLNGSKRNKLLDIQQDLYQCREKLENFDFDHFVEVNCRLRYHFDLLKSMGVNTVWWVRDGRDVVQSYMGRQNHFRGHHWSQRLAPDSYSYKEWAEKDRFEKFCWMWDHSNRFLQEHVGDPVKIEGVNQDYGYTVEHLAELLGIEIPETVWEVYRNEPEHTGKHPTWEEDWNEDQKETFEEACGDMMEELGYW